jgi:hypothetical protein
MAVMEAVMEAVTEMSIKTLMAPAMKNPLTATTKEVTDE